MPWEFVAQSRSVSGPVIRLDLSQHRFAINAEACRLIPFTGEVYATAFIEPEKQVLCLSLSNRYRAGAVKISQLTRKQQRSFSHAELAQRIVETGGKQTGEGILLTYLPNPNGSKTDLLFTYRTETYGEKNLPAQ